ncbi:MAG: hypothetical protein QXL15_00450 [Candidatus Korarchaeota archaeon]
MKGAEVILIALIPLAVIVTILQILLLDMNLLFTVNSYGCRVLLFLNGIGYPLTAMMVYEFLSKRTGPSKIYKYLTFILIMFSLGYGIYSLINAFESSPPSTTIDYIITIAKELFLISFFKEVWYEPAKHDKWRRKRIREFVEGVKKGAKGLFRAMKRTAYAAARDESHLTAMELAETKEKFEETEYSIELKSSWILSLAFIAFPALFVSTIVVIYTLHKFNTRTNRFAFYCLLVFAFLLYLISSFYIAIDIFYPLGIIFGTILYLKILIKK